MKVEVKQKIKQTVKKIIYFLLNPKLLLCLGIAWIITNGWSYIMMGVGTFCQMPWMIAVSGAYLTFLWLPISPEKIVTVAIAIGLLRLLFSKDEKTLGVLRDTFENLKSNIKSKKAKRAQKRASRKA